MDPQVVPGAIRIGKVFDDNNSATELDCQGAMSFQTLRVLVGLRDINSTAEKLTRSLKAGAIVNAAFREYDLKLLG